MTRAYGWGALVVAAALGCGRIDFELARDGNGSDAATSVAHVATFVARGFKVLMDHDTFTAHAQRAGDAVVFQVECNSSSAVASVSFTAPGWTLVQITPSLVLGAMKHAAVFGAIAPDTNPATFTVTWPATCSAYDELGDEFANADPTGGTTTFHGLSAAAIVGDCSATVVTSGTGDAVWAACSGGGTLTDVSAGYTKSADDLHDDWTAFRLTQDPPGTQETITMTNALSTATSVITALTIISQQP